MEARTLRCPNCGANATNHNNCEYCGSLLVRFVEKGIDLSKTSYVDNTGTFPGLIEALRMNLQMQNSEHDSVVTDIVGPRNGRKSDYLACILRSGKASFMDGTEIPSNSNKGLCVAFTFAFYTDSTGHKNYNKTVEDNYRRFGALDCFPLFTEHSCTINSNQTSGYGNISEEQNVTEYFIDFGEDAEGAARLLSRIFQEVYGLTIENKIECYTNKGIAIDNCRARLEKRFNEERFIKYTPRKRINEELDSYADKLIKYSIIGFIVAMILLYLLQ